MAAPALDFRMRAFVFKFESLFKILKEKEKKAFLALIKAENSLKELQEIFGLLKNELKEIEELIEKTKIGSFTVFEMDTNTQYLEKKRSEYLKIEGRIFSENKLIEEKKNFLINIITERKSIELLKEKQLKEWREKELKEERKTADECARIRYLYEK